MPFHIAPFSAINGHYENSTSLAGAPPQFFSFKENSKGQGEAGFALLNICPSSFKQFMQSDIGYRLLYDYKKRQGITKESINANSVFDCLPSLQIREYAIDSELDQLINLFRDLVNIFNPGDKNAPNNSVKADSAKEQPTQEKGVSESKSTADKIKTIWEKIKNAVQGNALYDMTCQNANLGKYVDNYKSSAEFNKVLRFPFAVYYRLLSCVTTNAYEVPIHPDVIMQSQSEGFEADSYGVSFPGQGAIGSIPIIGKVISRVMNTISISTTPIWDPSKTSKDGPTTTCKFKLFNDTVEAALMNFIFVNTIGPNNMWYNYSIFKRAPALYDIKIEGVYRYFMCTATVNVKPAGPVRKIPMAAWRQLQWKYWGREWMDNNDMIGNQLVAIPDIYDVELQFKSMLPNNFNNFLYVYAGNPDVMKSEHGYQKNIVVDFIQAIKDYIKI